MRSRAITRELETLGKRIVEETAQALVAFQKATAQGMPEDAQSAFIDMASLADIFKRLVGTQLVPMTSSDLELIAFVDTLREQLEGGEQL